MTESNPMETHDKYLKGTYGNDQIPIDDLEKYLMEAAVMNLISTKDTHISKEMTYSELQNYMEKKMEEKKNPNSNSLFKQNIFSNVKNAAENFFYAEEDTQIEEDFNAFKKSELQKINKNDNELVKKIVFSYLNYEEKKINKYENLIKRSIEFNKRRTKKMPYVILCIIFLAVILYVYLEFSCIPY